MYDKHILTLANYLYTYNFALYRFLYFIYKRRKDKYEINLFRKLINSGDTVLDIGANIGFSTLIFSDIVGSRGIVHSFEPEKTNYSHLKYTANRPNIVLNNCAIGSKSGSITLYTSNLINVDHKTYKTTSFKSKYRVLVNSIDNYSKPLIKVDFIKIDIQGGEIDALKGMKKTLRSNKNVILFMEYWPEAQRQRGYEISDFISYFNNLKMKIYVIREHSLLPLSKEIIESYLKYTNYDFDDWIVTRRRVGYL